MSYIFALRSILPTSAPVASAINEPPIKPTSDVFATIALIHLRVLGFFGTSSSSPKPSLLTEKNSACSFEICLYIRIKNNMYQYLRSASVSTVDKKSAKLGIKRLTIVSN